MIKLSDFQIEDLNDIEIYDLNLKFEKENIQNNKDEKAKTKIVESKFDSAPDFQLNQDNN